MSVDVSAKAYTGADVDSDRNPVVVKLIIKLKKVLTAKVRQWWNLEIIKDESTALDY